MPPMPKLDVMAVIGMAMEYAGLVVKIGLLLIFLGIVLQKLNLSFVRLPTMDPTPLAYLCGAWWLYKSAK